MSAVVARSGEELALAAREARAAWSMRGTLAVIAYVLAALVPLTGVLGSLDVLANGLYDAVAAVGLGLAVGIAGMPSLAQAAFVAVGAFVSVLVRIHLSLPLLPAVLLGALAAAAAGYLVGIGVARLRPAAIAVATLLVTWLVAFLLGAFPSAFGGAEGLSVPSSLSVRTHYELALALVALSALGFLALARAPIGLRLAAYRDHPAAAQAAGIRPARTRAACFAFAAGVGGLGGALAVDLAGVADPSAYGAELSFKLLVAVLLGGAVSALGGVAGIVVLGVVALVVGWLVGSSTDVSARFQTVVEALLVVLLLSAELDGVVPSLLRRVRGKPPRVGGRAGPAQPRGTPLRARGISKSYGGLTVLDEVDLELAPGSVHALVGPNGSGKTTALRVLAGTVAVDAGRVELGGIDLTSARVDERVRRGVARTLQASAVFSGLTALENVLAGVATRSGTVRTLLATPSARAEQRAARARALEALDAVGLRGRADVAALELSSTEQRLVMVARALAGEPAALLLDELAAGVGAAELPRLAALVQRLRERGVALLLVEHNLGLVRTVADTVTVLDAGQVVATGPVEDVWDNPAVRSVFLGRRAP